MFSPGGIGAARDVVSRFVAEQGEEAYDPRDWLAPLQRELIAQDAQSPSDSGRGTALAEGVGLAADVECLMEVRCSCTTGEVSYCASVPFYDPRSGAGGRPGHI